MIKFNYLSVVVTSASGFYERALNKQISLQLGLLYDFPSRLPYSNITIQGVGLTPEVRFYPFNNTQAENENPIYKPRYPSVERQKSTPSGFYIGSFFRYRNTSLHLKQMDVHDPVGTAKIQTIGAGILAGYQVIIPGKYDTVSLDFFGGPHLNSRYFTASNGLKPEDYNSYYTNPLGFRLGATLGIVF